MLWLKHILLLPLVLLVGACGFTPVHAPGGAGHALYDRVLVAAPEKVKSNSDVAAYALVRALEEKLGRGTLQAYQLDLELEQKSEGQAITADNDITRFSVEGTAKYTLTRLSDGVVMASGTVKNFTGYSATGSTVETLAGERDAEERLMEILANQIVTRLYSNADIAAAQ